MSKRRKQNPNHPYKSVKFIDFWCEVALEVGSHRFSINDQAKQLQDLFSKKDIHADHVKNLVRQSLPDPHGNLEQTIDVTRLLDELGEVAFELRKNSADDLLDIEFLEEIAWVISSRYHHLIRHPKKCSEPAFQPRQRQEPARVFSLSTFKTRRANRRL